MTTKEELLKEWMPKGSVVIARRESEDTEELVIRFSDNGETLYQIFRIFGMLPTRKHLSVDYDAATADELIKSLFEETKPK